MEIKLFGKSLFSVKSSRVEQLLQSASTGPESKFLPDFYRGFEGSLSLGDYITLSEVSTIQKTGKKAVRKVPKVPEKPTVTPKGAYELKLLHDDKFILKTDPAYVDQQIADFKDKLALITSEEYDMRKGVKEIDSIVTRMVNRKKYPEVKEFFEQYPYTTSGKVAGLIERYGNLQIGQVAEFLADMPKEATEAMKGYNAYTQNVCGRQAVFYIIADKKDFKKTQQRRDPILLAQSPFGHVWQILGAWDEEMLMVDEL